MKNSKNNSTHPQLLNLQNLSIVDWQNSTVVINKQDKILGAMDKYSAHQHPPVLHQAVSVWLFNEKGEVLLQQRSDKKQVSPLKWGNAVCGNVRYDETRLACAYRRLYQELGIGEDLDWDEFAAREKNFQKYGQKIGLILKPIFKFSYQADADSGYFEHEIDQVYTAKIKTDLKMTLNPAEVKTVQWVSAKEFQDQLARLNKLSPQESLKASKQQLEQNFSAQTITLNFQKFEIAPWTVMMGQDERMKKVTYDQL